MSKTKDHELCEFKRIDLIQFAWNYNYHSIDKKRSSQYCTVLKGPSRIGISKDDDGTWIFFDLIKGSAKGKGNCQGYGGSIIDFVMLHENCNLGQARKILRNHLGTAVNNFSPTFKTFFNPQKGEPDRKKAKHDLAQAHVLKGPNNYLDFRGLDSGYYLSDRFKGKIGVSIEWGNILFPHHDQEGFFGFEKKNFKFDGFTKHGQRCFWYSKINTDDKSFFFSESGIDCLSYHQLHQNDVTAYFSTAGGFSDVQLDLIFKIREKNPDKLFILGFDNDDMGNIYIQKILKKIGDDKVLIDQPQEYGQDWNNVLKGSIFD